VTSFAPRLVTPFFFVDNSCHPPAIPFHFRRHADCYPAVLLS
jgi:hypothetical protein